ncbi:MAG: hypothetical protein WBM53_01930 [Maribacter sp.]
MLVKYLASNFNRKGPTLLLKILLIVDILFIIGHICSALLHHFELGTFRAFMVDQDGGYPELFQYLKYLTIVLLVAKLAFDNKKYDYLPWLVLFLILFFDDAFMLHEQSGVYFVEVFNLKPAFGLRALDIGEFTFAVLAGLVFLGPLLWFYIRGSEVVKKTFFDISILFSILLFFAIGVDMVHQLFEEYYVAYAVIALIEDGGEMIALSVLVWYFYFIGSVPDGERTFLCNYFIPKRKI